VQSGITACQGIMDANVLHSCQNPKKKKKVQTQTNKRHLTKRFCILPLLLVGAGLACGPASLFTTTMVFMETCVHQGNYWHVDWLRTPNWHP